MSAVSSAYVSRISPSAPIETPPPGAVTPVSGTSRSFADAGAWITVSADAALLFDDDYARKWERAMARRRLLI